MLGSIISGIAGVASAYMSYRGQQTANKQNLQEADRNRQWQERMSSTSHQREVADLKKAGLNPVLSAHGGASTPGGAQGTVISPTKEVAQSMLSSSKAINNIKLTKELINTEKTKQILNQVASAKGYQDGRTSKYHADLSEMATAFELSKFGRNIHKWNKSGQAFWNVVVPKLIK